MPGGTASAAAGHARTRNKVATAAAATTQPSSSEDSQHTICDLDSKAPASPCSKPCSRGTSSVRKTCNEQQQSKPDTGHAQQAVNVQQLQPDLTQSIEHSSAVMAQDQASKKRRSDGDQSDLAQGIRCTQHQQQQQQQPQSDPRVRFNSTLNTRSRSRSAAAAAAGANPALGSSEYTPPCPEYEAKQGMCDSRTAGNFAAALIEAAEAADIVAWLCNNWCSQNLGTAASWDTDKQQQQQQHLQCQQDEQPLQQPACLQHQPQDVVPAAAAAGPPRRSSRLAGFTKARSPPAATPDAAAAAAAAQDDVSDHSSSGLATPIPPSPSGAGAAELEVEAVPEGHDQQQVVVAPTSLQARFARLSAEQQLSILLELQQLTELEDALRAKQAAHLAAAEEREKVKEAAREHKRRSGRLHKATDHEGGASRSGTPGITHTSTPKPLQHLAGACVAEASNIKRVRMFEGLELPIDADDFCVHTWSGSKRPTVPDRELLEDSPCQLAGACMEGAANSKRVRIFEGLELPLDADDFGGHTRSGNKRARRGSDQTAGGVGHCQLDRASPSPEPVALQHTVVPTAAGVQVFRQLQVTKQETASSEPAAVSAVTAGDAALPAVEHGGTSGGPSSEHGSSGIQRLGARAQARKAGVAGKWARMQYGSIGEVAIPASGPVRSHYQ